MEETKDPNQNKIKTRTGSGYLKQLYATARTTASSTHSHLKNLTTLLVNFVPIDKVDASELQVRVHFDDDEIQGLAQSIRQHGVLQPILVVQDGDRYKVIAGERRLRASKLAGMDRIPARVITTDDKATHEIALRENLDRVDLHPIEEGEAYLSLLEAKAYSSHEAIAKGFMKPKSRITECIGFTRLPPETKQEVMKRGIKQRLLLRKLLQAPVEQHSALIQEAANAGDVDADSSLANRDVVPNASEGGIGPRKTVSTFEYKLDEKGLYVPSFRWKANEDKEKLRAYVQSLRKLLEELGSRLDAEPPKDAAES